MRVAISFFNSIIGGPREVTRNLLRYIPDIDKSIEYIVFTDTLEGLDFLEYKKNVEIKIIKKFSKYDLLIWEQILAPYYAKKYSIDIFHGTKNSIPFFGSFKKVCTIHDLAYFVMPETFSFMQRFHLKLSCLIAKIYSTKITAVSNNTKKDITQILDIDSSKIEVIYNAIDEKFLDDVDDITLKEVKDKYNLPKKFFLHVGTLQPRKNISTIVDAFATFKKTDTQDFRLVLAGRKGWYFDEISRYIEKSGVAEYVIFTGAIENEELISFYKLAYLFIYASNYDGFGLVPLEAMATGCATICSEVSSLPEVIGNSAIGINPKSACEINNAMELLVKDKCVHEKYCLKGVEQAKKFNWKISAQQYVDLYKSL